MKILILLDIDGTLLNQNYKITSNQIFAAIEKCKRKGIIFCLNSNRSIEDLLPIYKHFKLNGFIIGENGAFVLSQTRKLTIYANSQDINMLKTRLPVYLTKMFKNSRFIFEDTVNFLKSKKVVVADIVFLANKYRKYTMSIHVKQYKNNHLIKNLQLTQKVAKFVAKLIKKLHLNLTVTTSDTFGNVLVLSKKCNKGTTFNKIHKREYKDYKTIMIGDDFADEPLLREIDFFCTVGNAEKSIKLKADFVSSKTYTKGVVDILLNKLPLLLKKIEGDK